MKIGNKEFQTKGHTYVMGILNLTPDSFSDGGRWNDKDRALLHVEEMLREGADIIDIGGESTRPGYTMLPVEEEIERVLPVIRAVKAEFEVPVSLDTYKSQVAAAGIEAGADMINDIWGLRWDNKIADVIAGSGLPCCLMHNRKAHSEKAYDDEVHNRKAYSEEVQDEEMNNSKMHKEITYDGQTHVGEHVEYQNFMQDVAADLAESLRIAKRAGIACDRIILDPGVGFAKTYEQNLEIIRSMDKLHELGCPLLLGCSRKSVVGLTLDLPVEERLEGTLATTVIAVIKGCMFVRVHDVMENVRAVRMTEAVLRGGCV